MSNYLNYFLKGITCFSSTTSPSIVLRASVTSAPKIRAYLSVVCIFLCPAISLTSFRFFVLLKASVKYE